MSGNLKARKGKPKSPANADKLLPMASELFPELNATFYTGDPAEF